MSEYRVEVTPGRELVYPTLEAFRAAMYGGIITADSRIFHRATSTWVCITEHPEYRRYQAEISPLPWFDRPPVGEPEAAENPQEPKEPRVIGGRSGLWRRLAGLGATLARQRAIPESNGQGVTGWAAIKKWFSRSSATPGHNQPNQAAPRVPTPPRDHYTFLG